MPTEKTGEHFPFAPTPSHHITPQEESSSKICIHRAFRPAKQPENHKMMESVESTGKCKIRLFV